MKIVMLSFVGGGRGAAATHYLSQLSSALSETNNITVIVSRYTNVKIFDKRINLIKFSIPSNLLKTMLNVFNPFLYRFLANVIYRVNPDVIQIAFELRFSFFFALLLCRNYPIIVTVHEPKPFSVTKSIITSVIQRIKVINCKLLIKSSDKVIVHGEKHREYLLSKKVPSSKIEVIPHGDFSSFFLNKKKSDIKCSKHNILFFGRIEEYKGIEYLIQAGKLVKDYIPDISITIAGNGNFKYNKLIGRDKNFLVINRFISEEEVAELFQKASLVVLPYVEGSQSGIISIAYGFEKPVIATNVGNFAEMVEDRKTGLIVPPKDPEALAEAIVKLLDDDELRKKMGKNAYKMMKEELSWDRIAEKTNEVYKEVINEYKNKRRKIDDQKVHKTC